MKKSLSNIVLREKHNFLCRVNKIRFRNSNGILCWRTIHMNMYITYISSKPKHSLHTSYIFVYLYVDIRNVHAFTRLRQLVKQIYINYYSLVLVSCSHVHCNIVVSFLYRFRTFSAYAYIYIMVNISTNVSSNRCDDGMFAALNIYIFWCDIHKDRGKFHFDNAFHTRSTHHTKFSALSLFYKVCLLSNIIKCIKFLVTLMLLIRLCEMWFLPSAYNVIPGWDVVDAGLVFFVNTSLSNIIRKWGTKKSTSCGWRWIW